MAATKEADRAPGEDPKPKGEANKKPDSLRDIDTPADYQAQLGHFAEVASGEHQGRYGVVVQDAGGENVVLQTRDTRSERLVVAYKDLRPAKAGRR